MTQKKLQSFAVQYFKKSLTDNKMNQNDLAANLDMSRQTVSNYLTDKTELTLNMFERFSEAINISIVDLILKYANEVLDLNKSPFFVEESKAMYSTSSERLKHLEENVKLLKSENAVLHEALEDKKKIISLLEGSGVKSKQTGS